MLNYQRVDGMKTSSRPLYFFTFRGHSVVVASAVPPQSLLFDCD